MKKKYTHIKTLTAIAGLALVGSSANAALWTPEEITTAMWLDASDSDTITVDGFNRVSQWDDKSGNDLHVTQGTASRRPIYSTTGWGGTLPTLQLASYGAQKDAIGRVMGPGDMNGTAYTLFIVLDAQSADNEEWIHTAYTANGKENRHQMNLNGVKVRSDGSNGGSATAAYVAGQQILQFTLATGASEILRNGVQIAGNGTGTYTPAAMSGTFSINGRNPSNGHAGMPGSVSEWIYLAENPSTDDRVLIEGYLAHKWGLEGDLDAGHLYKSAAPEIVPEPSSAALLGLGGLALILRRRK